jgi:hypothetical protein
MFVPNRDQQLPDPSRYFYFSEHIVKTPTLPTDLVYRRYTVRIPEGA